MDRPYQKGSLMAIDLKAFLPSSELSEEATAKEPTLKRLTSLKSGVSLAVPVDGLAKEEYKKRGDSGEKGTRYILTDANGTRYQVGETLARQIAKGLAEAVSKKRAGVLWKVKHEGKRVQLG